MSAKGAVVVKKDPQEEEPLEPEQEPETQEAGRLFPKSVLPTVSQIRPIGSQGNSLKTLDGKIGNTVRL